MYMICVYTVAKMSTGGFDKIITYLTISIVVGVLFFFKDNHSFGYKIQIQVHQSN